MFINDNTSHYGKDIPLKLDETDMRSSGLSFFDAGKNKNDQT